MGWENGPWIQFQLLALYRKYCFQKMEQLREVERSEFGPLLLVGLEQSSLAGQAGRRKVYGFL